MAVGPGAQPQPVVSAVASPQASRRDEGWPRYVAIITDGNGRWAHRHGLRTVAGHEAGADAVKATLRDAVSLGIKELTVYSFSTENWSRDDDEVSGLMEMFGRRLEVETPELHDGGARVGFVGRGAGRTSTAPLVGRTG